jgi:hypothetical protein
MIKLVRGDLSIGARVQIDFSASSSCFNVFFVAEAVAVFVLAHITTDCIEDRW